MWTFLTGIGAIGMSCGVLYSLIAGKTLHYVHRRPPGHLQSIPFAVTIHRRERPVTYIADLLLYAGLCAFLWYHFLRQLG